MKIVLSEDVHKKIMHWVNKSKYEVSGLGTVKVEPNGVIRVVSAMLLPQSNGPTHTDIEAEAVCKAMYDLRDAEGELKFWWHSHVDFNVFWSGTDMTTIKEFGEHDWIIATVFNQKNEMKSSFYDKKGLKTPWGQSELFLDNLETTIDSIADPRVIEWDAEYAKNVSNVPVVQACNTATTPATTAVDDYGYDAIDWEILKDAGYTQEGVDKFLDLDFTPNEILVLAEAYITHETVTEFFTQGFSKEDLLKQARSVSWQDDAVYNRRGYEY